MNYNIESYNIESYNKIVKYIKFYESLTEDKIKEIIKKTVNTVLLKLPRCNMECAVESIIKVIHDMEKYIDCQNNVSEIENNLYNKYIETIENYKLVINKVNNICNSITDNNEQMEEIDEYCSIYLDEDMLFYDSITENIPVIQYLSDKSFKHILKIFKEKLNIEIIDLFEY